MDLKKLRIPDLLVLLEELGGSAGQVKRKPKIIELIQGIGADDDELTECWEMILQRREDEKREQELAKEKRGQVLAKEKREHELAKEEREYELALKRLELERLR